MKRKMIVLGRKKLIWTAIMLFGVMLPLMVLTYNVPVGQVSGEGMKMLKYSSEKAGFTFMYPQGWLIRAEKNYTGDVSETVSFSGPDATASGFVQVMVLSGTIPEYVLKAKEQMVPGYDSFQFGPKTVGDKNGYLLAYMRGNGDARSVAAEYFFKSGQKVYRFSCFYPESEAEKYAKLFTEMLHSYNFPKQDMKENLNSDNSKEQSDHDKNSSKKQSSN